MTRVADADQVRVIESAATGDELAFAASWLRTMRRRTASVSSSWRRARSSGRRPGGVVHRRRRLDTLRDPARLAPWLVSIAVNQAKDLLRSRHRRSRIEAAIEPSLEPGGVDPATGIDGLDLRAALARLEPDDRALLAMRYVAGFDSTELAAATGLDPVGHPEPPGTPHRTTQTGTPTMDDRGAFERQLARRYAHGGTGAAVDALAIARSAIATARSVAGRSPLDCGVASLRAAEKPLDGLALKFIVAAAIVVLFGGVLLITMTPLPHSHEVAPAAVPSHPRR